MAVPGGVEVPARPPLIPVPHDRTGQHRPPRLHGFARPWLGPVGTDEDTAGGTGLVDDLVRRGRPGALPEDERWGSRHRLEVRRARALVPGAGRDRVVELVEPVRRERVEVHGQPLVPRLLRPRLDLGGHVATRALHQRAAQPVAGEAVDAEVHDRLVRDQARQVLELGAPLVEAHGRGTEREEGGRRERERHHAAQHVAGHRHAGRPAAARSSAARHACRRPWARGRRRAPSSARTAPPESPSPQGGTSPPAPSPRRRSRRTGGRRCRR